MKYIKTLQMLLLMLTFVCSNLYAQSTAEISVSTTVYDQYRQPVSGATISLNKGAVLGRTDTTGKFSVKASPYALISIKAKGFKEEFYKANAVPRSISLQNDNSNKNYTVNLINREVNVKDLPGAITVINPEDYIDLDYSLTVVNGTAGRLAGLLGANNIWGMENALILIDGIARDINDITFNEVGQVTVLKGVNAVALYGPQAAKGAILITSRRGIVGPAQIKVRATQGISTPTALPKFLQSADFMTLYNEGRRNDGVPTLFTDAQIAGSRSGNKYRYPNVDYYSSEFIKNSTNSTDVNAGFTSGNETAKFYSNIGWSSNNSLLKLGEGNNEQNNRFHLRGNVDIKLSNRITTSIDVAAVLNDNRTGLGNYFGIAATALPSRYSPLIPISSVAAGPARVVANQSRNIIDGKYILGGAQDILTNPFADLLVGGYQKSIRRSFQLTQKINVDLSGILPGLYLKTRLNVDFVNTYLQSINNTYSVYAPTWNATQDSITALTKYGNDSRTGAENINNTAQTMNKGLLVQLGYDKTVNSDHNISAVVVGYGNMGTISGVAQALTYANVALEGKYNYKHKYWADFTAGVSNSTKLAAGSRSGFSPTVNLGWLVSSEEFMANAKFIDMLKLSVSAGSLNTDLDINNYYLYDNPYQQGAGFTWADGGFSNNATASIYGANPGLKFSKRKEITATLQGSFFNELISLQTTYFRTNMEGLPTQRFSQYPNYYSTLTPYSNYNANQYTGVDFAVGVNTKVGPVNLNIGLNGTFVKATAIKRDEINADAYQNRTGRDVSAIFGLVSKGFFANAADIAASPSQAFGAVQPGDIKYVDQNGDNIINERDEIQIGRTLSPFNYGLNIAASYKNFTLFVRGTSSIGGSAITNSNYFWVDGDDKYSEIVLNRWTPATAGTATFPRLSSLTNNNNFRNSDFWLYKTNNIMLNKVQITYRLPSKLIDGSFVKNLNIYVVGSNLYNFSAKRDIMNLNVGSAPQMRSFFLGCTANF
ncbi:SusC/RagA family TonB-linked outer membrane protein [Mucilaginibacter calamicampi]|uniref:SusC/RagA family TonB-linked outer membrane protein n=1 Tax=Mucilaginibacter calamicampi TaxID=1302352 RepID=A0ABW2Z2X9_9SPHI